MFLNAWTGSSDGARYGAADYGVDDYGLAEAGQGPTWPTASMRFYTCLLYTSPSPRDRQKSRMPSSA